MPPQTSHATDITLQPLTRPPTREPLQPRVPLLQTPQAPPEPLHLRLPIPLARLARPQTPQAHHAVEAALARQFLGARHGAPEVAAGGLRRDDVDEGVPEALEGQDEGFGVVEAEVVAVRVGEGVEPVDARGDPGDEQGAEEEEGDARVEPGFGVRFGEGGVAGEGAHAEDVGRGEFALLLVCGLADLYIDAVGVEAVGFAGFGAGDCYFGAGVAVLFGLEGGVAAGVGCDVDFGRDGAFEGVFVEGVEEALELMAVVPDFAESHQVDDPGEEECDPGLRCD